MSLASGLRTGIVLFLLFPFVFLLWQFQLGSNIDWPEFYWAFKNSLTQAFFSSIFSVIVGFVISLSLVGRQNSSWKSLRFYLEMLCILPNFLPPIFILLAVLNVASFFPLGLSAIVLIHTLINFGLVAVLIARVIESKAGALAELAYVEGAGRIQFILRGLIPLIKSEICNIGLFIFVVCFGSFSIPLIVGDGKGTTIEVLIYEKIRLSSDWSSAVALASLQSLFIFSLSFWAKSASAQSMAKINKFTVLRSRFGQWVLIVVTSIYVYGYLEGFSRGLGQLQFFSSVQWDILQSFVNSIFIGISVGSLSFLGLMIVTYCWPSSWFEKFLSGYVAPSTSLACFSLLIFGPNEGAYPFIKIPFALTLLGLNSLYRMGWQTDLQNLRSQSEIAYSMGADRNMIFRQVLMPQLISKAGFLAGIASVWACGDFAVSRLLAHKELTIAMMTETLMSGYRLSQATLLSGLIILSGVICFFICYWGSHVISRKFKA